jgi:phosphatidate phosphatase APP1
MPFLILTRAGFEDLKPRAGFSGTSLYVNPTLLSPDEVSALQRAGAEVHIFPSIVDPHAAQNMQAAIRFIEEQDAGPIWIEHAPPVAQKSVPAAPLQAQNRPAAGQTHKALHHRLIKQAGSLAGRALRHAKKRAFSEKPLLIIPYLGYGNAHRLALRGRVLLDEGFNLQSPEDSGWRNLVELYKRLESDQVAGARVRARFQGVEHEAVADRGGYFYFEIALTTPLASTGWHRVELELVAPLRARARDNPVRATAEVLVPPATARFGVISDIDDTILWTNVTNRLNMLLMLVRSNAHTRKPFKGVAAFYRALHEGAGGHESNPIFYVSSSPWHLFPPLVEFLRLQDIPVGPLILKELGLRKVFGSGRHHTHKLDKIESILRFYPHLQFILIGDSGEQDPEIYAAVVKRYPQAVRAIYIRNVNPDPSRIEALDHLIEEVRAAGTQLILAPDSEFAAAHAAAEGLIRPADMAAVRSDKKEDEAGVDADAGARS